MSDLWINKATSLIIDNRTYGDEFKDDFNAGQYDFFENTNNEKDTIEDEIRFFSIFTKEIKIPILMNMISTAIQSHLTEK